MKNQISRVHLDNGNNNNKKNNNINDDGDDVDISAPKMLTREMLFLLPSNVEAISS